MMNIKMNAALAATVLAALTPVEAFWRMPCRARSGVARIDPLISPGSVAEHVHSIHGSSGMSLLFCDIPSRIDPFLFTSREM